jgi:hypothetical protein
MESNDYLYEISNWNIDAKLDDTGRYFYHIQVIDEILKGNKSYITGRKGTGKTAVADYLLQMNEECVFKRKLTFKNFPLFDEKENITNWLDRVDILEDVIKTYIDDAKYLIIFDELDEDFIDMQDKKKYEDYYALLTSLFKSVQEIKSLFPKKQYCIFPVVCLREDIYDIIYDNNKNKWSDFVYNMEWNEQSMKNLLEFRLSRAIDPDKKVSIGIDNWNILFSDEDISYKDKIIDAFEYITENTLLRPRDYIRYISYCCEFTINRGGHIILPDTILEA